MVVFPHNVLALVSFILCLFFLQGGFLFFFFYYKVNRLLQLSSKEHLYFAIMSLGLSLYSFGAWQIYSTTYASDSAFWQQVQWVAGLILFVFFVLFSVEYLKLQMKRMQWVVILPSIFFILCALFDKSFLIGPPDLKDFSFWGKSYQLYEMDMGVVAQIAGFWMGIITLLLLFVWFFYLTQHRSKLRAAAIGIIFLIIAGFNELFVSLRYYRSPYMLEYGFFVFSLSFYYQLFSDFFDLYRENEVRAKNLEALNEESRFFINRVAHDLRSPLLSIEGFASFIQQESHHLKEKHKDYLERIQRNSAHMMKLLDDLKAFIQIGAAPEELEIFDLHDFIQETISAFEIRLENLRVHNLVSKNSYKVFFSKKNLTNIFSNLLDNAIKYAGEGEHPFIEISALQKGNKVEVSLRDNGPGIEEVHQNKIFQTFYRADTCKPGSGIGLSAVQKILENAGEKIGVDSSPGKGSRFFFTLPLVESES